MSEAFVDHGWTSSGTSAIAATVIPDTCAAVVYLKVVSDTHQVYIRLVAAKTRVAPANGSTIPRLELLSALLLSKFLLN